MRLVDKGTQVIVNNMHAQINHPDISKASGNEKAAKPFRFSKMALMDVKSSAFLVREKRFELESRYRLGSGELRQRSIFSRPFLLAVEINNSIFDVGALD